MKTTLLGAAFVAVTLIARAASAQSPHMAPTPVASPPFAQHHASTLEEGVLRGGADLLRGVGEMHYNRAAAEVQWQDAYNRALDNRLKRTATYFDERKLNREARAEERGQRPSFEDTVRYAKSRSPERLAAFHFDAARNRLIWPEAFYHSYFDAEREAIDRLMAARGGAGAESREVQALAAQMEAKLAAMAQARAVSGMEHVSAKKFITSLQYEMNFAPGAAGIAAK
ncbi:MAG: hypothetical protein KY475_15305 [Planctomycetes bacterium]|nr:hypothetical protein [Planctomycetota bacterium]